MRPRHRMCLYLSALIWPLAVASPALADRVWLRSGTMLVGTVKSISDGALTIELAYGEPINVPMEAVRGIETDDPRTVASADGDRLVGRLIYSPEDGQTVDTGALGPIALEADKIGALWEAGAPSPELVEAKARYSAERVWNGRVELGASGASGNAERFSIVGSADLERKTEFDRLTLFAEGQFSEENGESTQNQVRVGGRLERNLNERLLAFGTIELERDPFENLDLRAILTTGLGYKIINTEKTQWTARTGLGYQQENFQNGVSTNQGLIGIGYDFVTELGETARFHHQINYLPQFNDPTQDFRVDSLARLELPIVEDKSWSVNLRLRNQYDSRPQPGVEELDTTYSVSLGYSFH